jgi:hypothetical protein
VPGRRHGRGTEEAGEQVVLHPGVNRDTNHVFNSLIIDLSKVISVNRVRVLNIDLAMFDHVFLLDPSLKSTFARKQSCRSSLSLQLLFWPNFKFLYQSLSFGWSNARKNRSKSSTVFSCAPLCSSDAHTVDCCHRRASSTRRACRRSLPSVRRSYPLPAPSLSISHPFFFLLGFTRSRARAKPTAGIAPAKPRRPASILREI